MSDSVCTTPEFMRRAIELAKKGAGKTNPNPLVGAVIVKNNSVIAEGYHHVYGDVHAERDALQNCEKSGVHPAGATMYVTLEPCCHVGKQPPCVECIVAAHIACVVIGSRDPNPLVHGKGVAFLRAYGITVIEDFMKDECDALNDIFFHYITAKTPYVAVKYAMTLDGKIATKTGQSQWISCDESRSFVHELRNRYACILAGIGTVRADNPLLTCRIPGGSNPVRIICDSTLRIPVDSAVMTTAHEVPTLIVCSKKTDAAHALEKLGAEVICLPGKNGVDLTALMHLLGERKLDSVLIEGGAGINFSAFEANIVNHVYAFVAPQIFGGTAQTPVAGTGVDAVNDSFKALFVGSHLIGTDILLEYDIRRNTCLPA